MRRSILIAIGAVAAVVAIAASGATGAYGLSPAGTPNQASRTSASSDFQCTSDGVPQMDLAPGPDQTCVITGATGTCFERSDSPVVVQICTFTQATVAGNRRATAMQIIESKEGQALPLTPGGLRQDGTQTVNVDQAGGTGSNFLTVSQAIKQKLGPGKLDDDEENELEPAGDPPHTTPIVQEQESHQNVYATQGGAMAAGNSSGVSQFLKQRERASHAPSIKQRQNLEDRGGCAADDPDANMCVIVNQTSAGDNVSRLSEDYRQFQRAHDTLDGEQVQGNITPFKGGENHEIHQSGPNPKQIATVQLERQTQRAVHTGLLTQVQNGPRKGFGSTQTGNDADTWRGLMISTQTQTNRTSAADVGTAVFAAAGTQLNNLQYYGTSSGDIRASLTAIERSNGQSETVTNSCPATDVPGANHECAAVIVCGSADVDGPTTDQENGACVANSCLVGEIFNPVTRECEEVITITAAPRALSGTPPK